ncbi:GntR family transcriptional regulator [Nocardioides sp. GY 10127]|uniref:GntR family transcriptional regulator n=1 Tax=Nocardioides sp. GY 10127 TaxID=2569762 RepID=UPI0010A93DD1|nr:GntR family transcriptional regulator [Nocardioides sp. GY 10127]TIC78688.1 GntR family transcriptional regulator [Nocardioides sp. GY 10127]TIC81036.1 GntR family transcriptional regulator [Nocardioides sp. GY 10127]
MTEQTLARLDRGAPQPLWEQLQADLNRRLERGEFVDSFPGEMQLVADYEVSRHTVRAALRALRETGVIESARGRQPRVAAPRITQSQGTLYSLFASVESTGHRQRSVVRRLEVFADGVVASRLGLEESSPLVYLERVRMMDDEPLALDRVWLPAEVAAPLLTVDLSATSLYGALEAHCGIRLTGGTEQVRAVVPTSAERRTLGIGADVAALHLERVGTSLGRLVELRRTLVRGDRYALVTDLASPDRVQVTAES